MKQPQKESIISQLLVVVTVLIGIGCAVAATVSFLDLRVEIGLAAIAVGFVVCTILAGVAQLLNAVMRTAAACEEIVRKMSDPNR